MGFDSQLEVMLEERLAALARRSGDDVSFAVDHDPAVEELWQLFDRARQPEERISFGLEESPQDGSAPEGEHGALVQRMLERLRFPLVVETTQGSVHIQTRMGWTGDTTTYVAASPSPEQVAAHTAAMEASLFTSLHRLRLLTLIVVAAGKVAAMLAIPGAGWKALPIAYKCVRDIYDEWTARNPDAANKGVTPWQ